MMGETLDFTPTVQNPLWNGVVYGESRAYLALHPSIKHVAIAICEPQAI